MDKDYELLIEKEEMWAKMYIETLKENDIPYVIKPVYGSGLTLKTGMQDIIQIYVPSKDKEKAQKIIQETFSNN